MGISPSMDCGPCQGDLNASLPSDELSTNILRYKMQKMAMGSWVKAFCSISVETAGSQKMAQWKVMLSISVESAGSQKIP